VREQQAEQLVGNTTHSEASAEDGDRRHTTL
jgi:hypothetical protein